MDGPLSKVCLGVIALEVIVGLGSNVFIIFSFIFSGFRGTNSASYNNILLALNVSNMCYTILMSSNLLMYLFQPSLFNSTYISSILNYLIFCSVSSCSWLSAELCFYYFIKILQFPSRFIAWIKMTIDRLMPMIILMVEIYSFFASYMALYIYNQESSKNSTITASDANTEHEKQRMKSTNIVLVLTFLPFLIAISTTAISAVSLKLHSHRMKAHMGHTNARDYQSAVQILACLLAFYALIYFVMVAFAQEQFNHLSWRYWMCLMILFSFSMVQSGLLISGNPKLREAWRKLFTFK